ncbi:hypothetical protein A9D60_21590 [Leisingera sp. JC1]|nr:hypothetical protein A9D60_21590 [Leisingera sp. JC1]
MAISTQPAGSVSRPASAYSGALPTYLPGVGSKALITARSVVRTLQTARMISVLAGMSDQQLTGIGISRSNIPRYAERLISDE